MEATIKSRVARCIAMKPTDVFLRKDFENFGSPSRVTRALQELIKEGRIVRIGYGLYAKAKKSSLGENFVPTKPLESLAEQALGRMTIPFTLGSARREYKEGKSSQIPVALIISVGNSRISRKISVGKREVIFERDLVTTN